MNLNSIFTTSLIFAEGTSPVQSELIERKTCHSFNFLFIIFHENLLQTLIQINSAFLRMDNENLNFQAIKRLQKILDTKHQIHGKGNFPTIEVEPRRLIEVKYKE